jgi:hypothetical protein
MCDQIFHPPASVPKVDLKGTSKLVAHKLNKGMEFKIGDIDDQDFLKLTHIGPAEAAFFKASKLVYNGPA